MADVIAGRYRVEREIGKGGMATVFAATDLAPRDPAEARVALKRLMPSFAGDRSIVGRFEREARAAMALTSQHAVKVYGVGATERGVPYIAMELLDGFDLASVRKQARARDVAKSVDWILQAIDAIAEAHATGIIHRDIKPHNLFVAHDEDGEEIVKVLDFGIAKALSSDGQVTRTEEVIGSPVYMSPEQTKASKDVDDRTDIWSLGVCLYELLTGVLPFDASSVAEIYSKVLTYTPLSPTTLRPQVPDELSAIILRCLEKDRAMRWPDVAALAEALEPFGTLEGAAADARDRLRARYEATAAPRDSAREDAPTLELASTAHVSKLVPSPEPSSRAAAEETIPTGRRLQPEQRPAQVSMAGPGVLDAVDVDEALSPEQLERVNTQMFVGSVLDAKPSDPVALMQPPAPAKSSIGAWAMVGAMAGVIIVALAVRALKHRDPTTPAPSVAPAVVAQPPTPAPSDSADPLVLDDLDEPATPSSSNAPHTRAPNGARRPPRHRPPTPAPAAAPAPPNGAPAARY